MGGGGGVGSFFSAYNKAGGLLQIHGILLKACFYLVFLLTEVSSYTYSAAQVKINPKTKNVNT